MLASRLHIVSVCGGDDACHPRRGGRARAAGTVRRRRRDRSQEPEATAKLNGKIVPVVSLAELDAINVRNLNELDEKDAIYAHQLARFTKEELLSLPNFGVKAVAQCCSALDAIGFEHPD